MFLRLIIGGVIIGREEITRRFQESQSQTQVPPTILNEETPVESERDRARYAMLGVMANSSAALDRNLSLLGRVSNRLFRGMQRVTRPLTDSRMMRPIQRHYQRFSDRGQDVVSGWIAAGRREEYLSRQLVQDTATEAIEETLDYLAESPEMDELVHQQSGDLLDDVFDDVFEDISGTRTRAGLIMSDWFKTVILRRPGPKAVLQPGSKIQKDE